MTNKRSVWLTLLLGVIVMLVGCELVVDFDRSKIPVPSPDGGEADVSAQGLEEAGAGDATVEDTGAGAETGSDTGVDTGTDTGTTDAGEDSSLDAPDGEF
jgi:hypothetical protein